MAGYSHHLDDIRTVVERAQRSGQAPQPVARKLVKHPSGMMVPASIIVPRQDDLDHVFRKMATGLFYWREGVLPPVLPAVVVLMGPEPFDKLSRILITECQCAVQKLGADVWWISACGRDGSGLWLFMLHGAVGVGVWMGKAIKDPNIPPSVGVAVREYE